MCQLLSILDLPTPRQHSTEEITWWDKSKILTSNRYLICSVTFFHLCYPGEVLEGPILTGVHTIIMLIWKKGEKKIYILHAFMHKNCSKNGNQQRKHLELNQTTTTDMQEKLYEDVWLFHNITIRQYNQATDHKKHFQHVMQTNVIPATHPPNNQDHKVK